MTLRQTVGVAIGIFIVLIFATWRVNAEPAFPPHPKSAIPLGCRLVEEEIEPTAPDLEDGAIFCPKIYRVYECQYRFLAIIMGPYRNGCSEMRFWKFIKTES